MLREVAARRGAVGGRGRGESCRSRCEQRSAVGRGSDGWLTMLPCFVGAQASGDLERGKEEVARLVYSMLQDANSIGHAQTKEPGTFQRLSSTSAICAQSTGSFS